MQFIRTHWESESVVELRHLRVTVVAGLVCSIGNLGIAILNFNLGSSGKVASMGLGRKQYWSAWELHWTCSNGIGHEWVCSKMGHEDLWHELWENLFWICERIIFFGLSVIMRHYKESRWFWYETNMNCFFHCPITQVFASCHGIEVGHLNWAKQRLPAVVSRIHQLEFWAPDQLVMGKMDSQKGSVCFF